MLFYEMTGVDLPEIDGPEVAIVARKRPRTYDCING